MEDQGLVERIVGLIQKVVQDSTGRTIQIAGEDRIVEQGLLDSLSMVNLVVVLQSEFDVDIGVTDLNEVTFASPASIAAFVRQQRGA